MTDIIDQANQHAEQMLALQIAQATRAKPRGPAECDCGEEISELRRDLGATRCITCQEAHEHRVATGRRG